MDIGMTPRRGQGGIAKAVTAVLMGCLGVLALQQSAFADTGRQRFHVIYAGPLEPDRPPTPTVIASGVIDGKGYQQLISQRPGSEPNTIEATSEFVFPEGSVSVVFTATFDSRFIAPACTGINKVTGNWMITGGTGAYTGATGEGTFSGHNILSGQKTPDGCPGQPDRLVSNLRGLGTVTVPNDQAA